MSLLLALFFAGILTILLPCILPLVPIVLGVSIAGRSKWRPLLTILGMVVSFVFFTFLLLVVLNQFVELADYIRIATYAVLFLFGIGFLVQNRTHAVLLALLGGFFFMDKGLPVVVIAAIVCALAMELGGRVAVVIQRFGSDVQTKARNEFGSDSPITAFIIGLTLGLVWVPCAGPALGFAFTLVREEPGPMALLALSSYAFGTALPLLIVGYGGQVAVHSVRSLAKWTGVVKQIAGVLLILTALGLHFRTFEKIQLWLLTNTMYGDLGTRLEQELIARPNDPVRIGRGDTFNPLSSPTETSQQNMKLPILVRAPEFIGLGPWHNSEPFTLASLKGKVVLVDFWTYSCINCIRTLPYIEGYWEKFKETDKFVLLGVHTPEFTFEKSEKNVAMAIRNYDLTYPVAQDNDFRTWSAFSNRYWPAKYLIDANGYIRYTHFGEGDYEETDRAIASLLAEIGVDAATSAAVPGREENRGGRPRTPETYMSSRSWPALGNSKGSPTDGVVAYEAPDELTLHKFYFDGSWQLVDNEYAVLRSTSGEIAMKFQGSEVNLVLGLEEGSPPITAEVFIDGENVKTIEIKEHDLYNLFTGDYGEHDLVLSFKGKGVQAFAFTFGG